LFPSGRTVTLSPFKIAKYETTYELWYEVKQWATDAARGSNKYTFANAGCEGHDGTDGAPPSSTGTAKLEPVTGINWRDAIVWCNAYSEMDGKEPVYYTDTGYSTVLRISTNESGIATTADRAVMKTSANGYRLPTEAQWEYAARGGKAPSTSGSFTNKWAGTNVETNLSNYAWYNNNSYALGNGTNAVGGKGANSLGLHDMSGNVWELCWDWYGGISSSERVTDPLGSGTSSHRIIRGGAWVSDASSCAVTYRNNYKPDPRGSSSPDGRNYVIGFRVVAP
jgi:formylglycine-generating enzyme required for sulfatase activity